LSCLVYLYYAAVTSSYNLFLAVAFVSLAIEGFVVYFINNGNCPLTYVQERIGDKKPFFELFFPKKFAENAFKIFSIFTWIAVALLALKFL